MEPDQVSFALHSVVQTKTGKLAVAGIGVVQVDILHGGGNHRVPRNGGVAGNSGRQQEQGGISHKVLDVVDAKLGLHGDVRRTQVIVSIQDIRKSDDRGHVLRHTGELIQHLALGFGESRLPSGSGPRQRSGIQEGVEIAQHHILELG